MASATPLRAGVHSVVDPARRLKSVITLPSPVAPDRNPESWIPARPRRRARRLVLPSLRSSLPPPPSKLPPLLPSPPASCPANPSQQSFPVFSWSPLLRAAKGGPIGSGVMDSSAARSTLEKIRACCSSQILLPEKLVSKSSAAWSTSVVGHFLGKPPSYSAIAAEASRWVPGCCPVVRELSLGCFLFSFLGDRAEEAVLHLLANAPHAMAGAPLRVQRWKPLYQPLHDRSVSAPVWLRFEDLPIDLWEPGSICSLAAAFGEPLLLDRSTSLGEFASGARVLVQMDLSSPPLAGISAKVGGKEVLLLVVYETLPSCCLRCGGPHATWDCGVHLSPFSKLPPSAPLRGPWIADPLPRLRFPGKVLFSRPTAVASSPEGPEVAVEVGPESIAGVLAGPETESLLSGRPLPPVTSLSAALPETETLEVEPETLEAASPHASFGRGDSYLISKFSSLLVASTSATPPLGAPSGSGRTNLQLSGISYPPRPPHLPGSSSRNLQLLKAQADLAPSPFSDLRSPTWGRRGHRSLSRRLISGGGQSPASSSLRLVSRSSPQGLSVVMDGSVEQPHSDLFVFLYKELPRVHEFAETVVHPPPLQTPLPPPLDLG